MEESPAQALGEFDEAPHDKFGNFVACSSRRGDNVKESSQKGVLVPPYVGGGWYESSGEPLAPKV